MCVCALVIVGRRRRYDKVAKAGERKKESYLPTLQAAMWRSFALVGSPFRLKKDNFGFKPFVPPGQDF